MMVLCRLKWRPFTGDARWRWDRSRPDPVASAWQRLPLSLDALLSTLYAASAHDDRSLVATALDHLLKFLGYWSARSPKRVAELFERLEPARLVRAVGQILLASTRSGAVRSAARQDFLRRFLEDLRLRGTAEATIERLRRVADAP